MLSLRRIRLLRFLGCALFRLTLLVLLAVLLGFLAASAQGPSTSKEVEVVYPQAHALYLDLHQNPELSAHETQTAAKLAGRLRSLGYEVTEHVGGTGVVAILKNGAGPVVMLRTELDALPVEEKTGLPYASKVRIRDKEGLFKVATGGTFLRSSSVSFRGSPASRDTTQVAASSSWGRRHSK